MQLIIKFSYTTDRHPAWPGGDAGDRADRAV